MVLTDRSTSGPPAPTPAEPEGPATVRAAPLRPTLKQERRLWRAGHHWVAGLDEVGRGAWAGPVSVGVAVIRPDLRTRTLPAWLRDSKLLAEERRESVFTEVARWCADGAVGHADAEECDRFGMTAALRLAAYRALAALELRPDALLIDGPYNLLRPPAAVQQQLALDDGAGATGRPGAGPVPLPEVDLPETVVPVVDGDALCATVAAASVLAKVVRDRLMREEAEHFPAYHFERNKGYPSPLHQIALRGYGLSAIHRRSWAFVDDLPWR
ncbi:MAG: ribonuclease HII [Acidimicrobiales bacterium]